MEPVYSFRLVRKDTPAPAGYEFVRTLYGLKHDLYRKIETDKRKILNAPKHSTA